jgi:multidrug efflux pump subunit AcrB
VTPQDLAVALRVGNVLQSSGSLVAGNREVLVETGTYLESAADVRQLVVAVRGTPASGSRCSWAMSRASRKGPISRAATSGWATVTASFRQ